MVDASTAPATPTVIVSKVGLSGTNSIRQLAISPDGGSLYVVGPASGTITSFALPNLDVQGPTYGFSDYPVGIAISPDGGTIAGGTWAPTNPDVSLFTVGGATPTRTYQFGSTETLRDGGLLYTSDGTHIFAVTKDSLNGVLFHSLATGNLPAGTLTIKASAGTVTYGKSVTLTAHLGTASANRTVSIYRHAVSGGPDALVKTATVNSSGNLVVTVKPGMNMYYSAAWLGDATHDQTASSNVRVNVRVVMHISASGGYKTLSGYRLYHYTTACHASHKGCPTVLTYATPLKPGVTVHMTLQQRVGPKLADDRERRLRAVDRQARADHHLLVARRDRREPAHQLLDEERQPPCGCGIALGLLPRDDVAREFSNAAVVAPSSTGQRNLRRTA